MSISLIHVGSDGSWDISHYYSALSATGYPTSLSTLTRVGLASLIVRHSLLPQQRMVLLSTRHFVRAHVLAVANRAELWQYLAMRTFNTSVRGLFLNPLLLGFANIADFVLIGLPSSSGMALVWLFSRQIPLALLPFMVYSIFHVATYTRTNLLPTLQPPQHISNSASPGGRPATKASPMADTIGRFVKEYYDASMMLVATLELALWFRILFSAIIFTKGSWILIVVYSVFIRARYSQSSFVQGAIGQFSSRVDAAVANQSTPPTVRQGWETIKGVARRLTDQTDVNRYAAAQQPGMKKAQ